MFFAVEKIEKYLPVIRAAIHREAIEIPRFRFKEGMCDGAENPEYDDTDWQDFAVGQTWGGYDVVAWFRARLAIPENWHNRKMVLRFLVGPRDGGKSTAETMVYVNGKPLQGNDIWHEEAWLPPELAREDEISIALRSWSGVYGVPDRRTFREARLVWTDDPTERFYYLANTMLKSAKQIDEDDLRRTRLLQLLDRAFNRIDLARTRTPKFYRQVEDAWRYLTETLERFPKQELEPRITGIGHSHIDMAWMWRLCHTHEKAGRTFSTVLNLMRQYPEYRFMHSTPQLYEFVKYDYPDIYARIRERIASGDWELTGGMWVESDTNIPSGESLVRQFLLGKRFIKSEFGQDSKVLWLPDSFGFSWVLPQLMRKSGVKYFITAVISWSRFNRFPHDTFIWRGMDGSEVLAHFITTPGEYSRHYSYIGRMEPYDVCGSWENYRQKDINDELLLPFGWGDGGGGPTREMLESARALRNMPGMPRVELGKVEPYCARLEKRLEGKELTTWDGELYLEALRGAYTSQSRNKRANRKAEMLYHNAEWLNTTVDLLTGESAYPGLDLRAGWELILLNQFHDVLAGTSIHDVHLDSLNDYERAHQIGSQALRQGQETLAGRIQSPGEGVVVFNSLSWTRGGLVELPLDGRDRSAVLLDEEGEPLSSQIIERESGRKLLAAVPPIPSLGYRAFAFGAAGKPRRKRVAAETMTVSPEGMENCFFRIHLNAAGQIDELYDKVNRRSVLEPGKTANTLQMFEDRSIAGEAWEIDIYYQEKMQVVTELLEAVVEEQGPLRGVLRLRWRFYGTEITQRMVIYDHSPRIDFQTVIDWHEQRVLLKAAFPVRVRATSATYDIQFGNIERPTHWNTSWDRARFENAAHKWADLSEGNYGVALLNDCKYGYDIKDNVIRLSLHRSPTEPDELADQGVHEFTYSLLPHAGNWRGSQVVQEAYDLNLPLFAVPLPANLEGDLPPVFEFASVEGDGIILETVKKSEEGIFGREDAWIVRLNEYKQNRQDAAAITFGRPIRRAVECSLMEEDIGEVAWEGSRLEFAITPYEIKTFKVCFDLDREE